MNLPKQVKIKLQNSDFARLSLRHRLYVHKSRLRAHEMYSANTKPAGTIAVS